MVEVEGGKAGSAKPNVHPEVRTGVPARTPTCTPACSGGQALLGSGQPSCPRPRPRPPTHVDTPGTLVPLHNSPAKAAGAGGLSLCSLPPLPVAWLFVL